MRSVNIKKKFSWMIEFFVNTLEKSFDNYSALQKYLNHFIKFPETNDHWFSNCYVSADHTRFTFDLNIHFLLDLLWLRRYSEYDLKSFPLKFLDQYEGKFFSDIIMNHHIQCILIHYIHFLESRVTMFFEINHKMLSRFTTSWNYVFIA